MEEKIYKEFLHNESLKVISIEEILNKVKELEITSFVLSTPDFHKFNDSTVKILKTDNEHPFTIEDRLFSSGKRLYIDSDWYIKNQSKIEQLMCYIIDNETLDNLTIYSGCLVSDEIINHLSKNRILKTIILGSDVNPYILKYEDYLKFKSSPIETVMSTNVDSLLTDNFDKKIGYNSSRYLINFYTYEKLNPNKQNTIYLSKKLKEEEIKNIEYINSNIIFQLTDEAVFDVAEISSKLKQLNMNNKIILKVKNKNEFNKYIAFNNFEYENIFIGFGNSSIPFITYLKFEKMLYQMVESAKNLSPFEKFIYVYNITKQFKKFKENEEDKMKARNLYDILMNEYMVCVGYSNLFGDLLDKLDIPNINLTVNVDTSYDEIEFDDFIPEEKNVKFSGHARRYVYINDEKYGLNGFYSSDPTWDNNLEKDYYNHLIMTDDEVTKSSRFLQLNKHTVEELFNINSIEEFYNKINFLMRDYRLKIIITRVLENIEQLDINYYAKLSTDEKFRKFIEEDQLENISELVYELGNYILKRINKTVSGDTIMSAVEEVYRHSYGYSEEELQKKLIEVREQNKKRQEKAFPKRYSEYQDGRIEVYSNEINKFDTEETVNKVM